MPVKYQSPLPFHRQKCSFSR